MRRRRRETRVAVDGHPFGACGRTFCRICATIFTVWMERAREEVAVGSIPVG